MMNRTSESFQRKTPVSLEKADIKRLLFQLEIERFLMYGFFPSV